MRSSSSPENLNSEKKPLLTGYGAIEAEMEETSGPSQIKRKEKVHMSFYMLYFFSAYIFLLGVNIIIVPISIYDGLHTVKEPSWIFTSDLFITAFLCIEVFAHLFTIGRCYFHKWINIFDFAITVSCVIGIILYLKDINKREADLHNSEEHALRLVRDILRLVRVPYFIKIIYELVHNPEIFEQNTDEDDIPSPM